MDIKAKVGTENKETESLLSMDIKAKVSTENKETESLLSMASRQR